MKRLAEICIQRPVFATVLILALVVVGLVSYFTLGRRPVPERRLPHRHGHHHLAGRARRRRWRPRSPTRSRRRSTRSAASTSCARPRPRASRRSSSVRPGEGRRRRRAGGARQGQHDPRRAAAGHRPADRRRSSTPTPRRSSAIALSAAGADPRDHRDRRQACSGAGSSRSPASARCAHRRPQAADQRAGSTRSSCRACDLTGRGRGEALAAQNVQIPGGRVEQGPRELTLRTYGRVDDRRRSSARIVDRADATAIRCAVRDVGRASRTAWTTRTRSRDVERRARRGAAGAQAVGHEHRRGRRRGEGAPRRRCRSAAARRATSSRSCATSRRFIEAAIARGAGAPGRSARSSPRSSCCCSSATCGRR